MLLSKASYLLLICTTSIICGSRDGEVKTEEDLGVKYANRCEVCKILATELQSRLEETGKVHDVLEIGYSLDDVQPKKKTKYEKSELRLIESLDGVCERILEYNIHKERQDSTRFAKGMSQTFKTLHGLVDKGVKVDLGIPYELWDKPSAEITHMKTQCESLLEDNEESIEYWYWNLQGTKDLKIHLCTDHALRNTDNSCLNENLNTKGDQGEKPEYILKQNDKSSMPDREVKVDPEPAIDEDDLLVPQSKRKIKENADDIYDSYVPQSKHTPSKEYTNRNSKDTGSERIANKHRYGDLSDSYWTEPSQYVQRHLKENIAEDEPKSAQSETKDNDDKSKGLESEREEL